MSTESLPHQIDQATPVSAFLGTGNEAHGGEVSAALQDWIQRAMDALAAVGPPPVGVVPNSVPTQTLPALGEVTLEVEPSNIDTNNPLANPRHRREIIRAAFDYALAPPQTTSHSSEDRLDRRADTPMEVPGDPSENRPGCTSDVDASAGLAVANSSRSEPSPSSHHACPHPSPTPTAGVVHTPPMLPTTDAVIDVSMADRSLNAIDDEGQQAFRATVTSESSDHHRDGQGERNGDAEKANAIEVRTTDALQQDASISISQYEIEYARAERERRERKRKIVEDRQRAWAKDTTTSRKDTTTPRRDARVGEHKSRAPKTRRHASPPPALLSRLRDPPQNVCSYNSELDDPQLPSTPIHSPRDRSPTPSTPPPSQYAGLPLYQRLSAESPPLISRIGPHIDESTSSAPIEQSNSPGHPGPLFGRIGPPVDESYTAASSQRANDETRGRRTARAPRSLEPSRTPSCNAGPPQGMPTRKVGTAPIAAASVRTASAGSRKFTSTSSGTIDPAGSLKADGVRNSEHRLESASQRPVTLASLVSTSAILKTAEKTVSAVGVEASDNAVDAMVVDDPHEPTKAVASRTATETVAPQIVTPPPTPPTPSSNVDNGTSSNSPGPLPPPADSASLSTGVQVSLPSSHHNPGADESGIQPQSPHKRSYEELVTELLSSTIPLNRSHSTRAQELAPARSSSFVFSAPPVAPATSTKADPISSSVPEPTGAAPLPLSPLSALSSSATSSSPSGSIASLPIDPAELGEFIFSLPVDESAPVSNSRETTEDAMDVVQGVEWDQSVNTDEQSDGPSKMDEGMDEPMKVDEDTDEPMKVEEEEYMASTKGEEEEPAMKTENEVTSKTEEVKDEVFVPVRPAPRYEPRALVPKLRQHSAVSPSIGPSHSSLGHTTNSQSFWIEMPPRTLPQESYLPMSQDGWQPSRAQDEQQPLIPPPEQALRRSTRSTSSVYRRATPAQANSVRMAASAPASSVSAKSQIQPPSSDTAASQLTSASAQSSSAIVQSSPASAQSFSVPARASSTAAATGPSSATTNAIVASLGRSYRLPPSSEDEEEDARVTPILKLRRMNDDHPLERPSKRVRWA